MILVDCDNGSVYAGWAAKLLIVVICTVFTSCATKEVNHAGLPVSDKQWADFLADQDLVFGHPLKADWGESLFISDGLIGASVYPLENEPNSLRWELGRTDVAMETPIPNYHPIPERLPIGNIVLRPENDIIDSKMRLNLWQAQVEFELTTTTGKISGRSYVERSNNLLVIEVAQTRGEHFTLSFEEKWSITPKVERNLAEVPKQYLPPKPVRQEVAGLDVVIQERVRNGAHAVAYKQMQLAEGKTCFYLNISKHHADTVQASESGRLAMHAAVNIVRQASEIGHKELIDRHRKRWHAYYQQAWVSLPNAASWEKFYWIQLYKFASASHPDIPIVPDTMGPWYHPTDWGATWWNLNTQLTYFPTYTANRLDAGKSLITTINHFFENQVFAYRGKPNVITMGRNAPYRFRNDWGTWELGNLTWVLHNYWKHWKYSMDREIAEDLFPILKANMNYYFEVMETDEKGKIHLPKMLSPEYNIPTEDKRIEDTNYSLQSFQWGLQTLLELDSILGNDDPMREQWEEGLKNMIPIPQSENGFDIALTVPYAESHRHYSHLLTIFPYQTIHPEESHEIKELIRTSVDHWIGKPAHLSGYSYTGAAAMYAILRDGDKALEALENMYDAGINDKWHPITGFRPNTMYSESNNPVLETPLSVVESLNFMLLQSSGGVIRVFPAIPSEWKKAHFHNLRTEGAFLVSGDYVDGQIQAVDIESLAGEPCILDIQLNDFEIIGGSQVKLVRKTENRELWHLDMARNTRIRLVRK